jgi:hypothetical protein
MKGEAVHAPSPLQREPKANLIKPSLFSGLERSDKKK